MTTHDFSGKVAIVTGSGGGIGEAYARALASSGASVVVAELDAEKGEAVASPLRESGAKATFVATEFGCRMAPSSAASGGTSTTSCMHWAWSPPTPCLPRRSRRVSARASR